MNHFIKNWSNYNTVLLSKKIFKGQSLDYLFKIHRSVKRAYNTRNTDNIRNREFKYQA